MLARSAGGAVRRLPAAEAVLGPGLRAGAVLVLSAGGAVLGLRASGGVPRARLPPRRRGHARPARPRPAPAPRPAPSTRARLLGFRSPGLAGDALRARARGDARSRALHGPGRPLLHRPGHRS